MPFFEKAKNYLFAILTAEERKTAPDGAVVECNDDMTYIQIKGNDTNKIVSAETGEAFDKDYMSTPERMIQEAQERVDYHVLGHGGGYAPPEQEEAEFWEEIIAQNEIVQPSDPDKKH